MPLTQTFSLRSRRTSASSDENLVSGWNLLDYTEIATHPRSENPTACRIMQSLQGDSVRGYFDKRKGCAGQTAGAGRQHARAFEARGRRHCSDQLPRSDDQGRSLVWPGEAPADARSQGGATGPCCGCARGTSAPPSFPYRGGRTGWQVLLGRAACLQKTRMDCGKGSGVIARRFRLLPCKPQAAGQVAPRTDAIATEVSKRRGFEGSLGRPDRLLVQQRNVLGGGRLRLRFQVGIDIR
jgi:hypothetical protein